MAKPNGMMARQRQEAAHRALQKEAGKQAKGLTRAAGGSRKEARAQGKAARQAEGFLQETDRFQPQIIESVFADPKTGLAAEGYEDQMIPGTGLERPSLDWPPPREFDAGSWTPEEAEKVREKSDLYRENQEVQPAKEAFAPFWAQRLRGELPAEPGGNRHFQYDDARRAWRKDWMKMNPHASVSDLREAEDDWRRKYSDEYIESEYGWEPGDPLDE